MTKCNVGPVFQGLRARVCVWGGVLRNPKETRLELGPPKYEVD